MGPAREVLLLLGGAIALHPLVAQRTLAEVRHHPSLVIAAGERRLASRAWHLLTSVLRWESLISSCVALALVSLFWFGGGLYFGNLISLGSFL